MMSNSIRRLFPSILSCLLILSVLFGCTSPGTGVGGTTHDSIFHADIGVSDLQITNCSSTTMAVGETLQLKTNVEDGYLYLLQWTVSNDSASVNAMGLVTAEDTGTVTITVAYGDLRARALIEIIATRDTEPSATYPIDPTPDINPPQGDASDRLPLPEAEGSPAGYRPAASYEEALDRSEDGLLSGYLYVPDQAPNIDPDRPMSNGQYIRNSEAYYADDNTYIVVDAEGREVFRVYRGGGYITLEEVAAYLYAFGDVPANYVSGKKTDPEDSIWGEYLRLNHSKFSGSTSKYPYEPELPRISGCGGDLQYYEIDIGTTGTDCDPSYQICTYNDGSRITRGAARIVYSRFDANGNKVIDPDEKYIFYTYNHYNDFREYLNYYNGWGEMFGNITGGGTLSSKYDYNPTPYIAVVLSPLPGKPRAMQATILWYDFRREEELVA